MNSEAVSKEDVHTNCSLEGCIGSIYARKLCRKHYVRLMRHGSAATVVMVQKDNEHHGMSYSPEYRVWSLMRSRCSNPNLPDYAHYGGRGIRVCERWVKSFAEFLSDMGTRPSPRHSINRIEVNGDYTPKNCRWATREVQMVNRRIPKTNKSGFKGVFHSGGSWLAYIGVNGKRIHLGSFTLKEDAVAARRKAELRYHDPILKKLTINHRKDINL